jgi:peptide-methionine (S)-S-oxide reductase
MEGPFEALDGVSAVLSGYTGGPEQGPTYRMVSSGLTGHTEAVRVVWDTDQVSFADLLKLFWECHDPTQGMAQGNDRGSQYRSAIVTTTEAQAELAAASRDHYQQQLAAAGFPAITTDLLSGKPFYFAETHHQQYLERPGSRPYCSARPTGVRLSAFPGSDFKLPASVWDHYDWSQPHCVLRSPGGPITL